MKFIKLKNKIFLVIVIIYKKSLDLFVNRIKIAQFHLCTYLINYTFHSPTMHITGRHALNDILFFLCGVQKGHRITQIHEWQLQKAGISRADAEKRIASLKNRTCFLCSPRFSSFSFFSLFHHIVAF